jgi:hypothetical protein
MSSENAPVFPAPIEVDLDEFNLLGDNSFRLWLRFENGSYIALDFQLESEAHRRILDVLTQVVSERLSRLGRHGIVITGMTEIEEEDEEKDESS